MYYGGRLGLIVIRAEFNSIRTCRNVLEELKSATCLHDHYDRGAGQMKTKTEAKTSR